jgi:hypothetical protein
MVQYLCMLMKIFVDYLFRDLDPPFQKSGSDSGFNSRTKIEKEKVRKCTHKKGSKINLKILEKMYGFYS